MTIDLPIVLILHGDDEYAINCFIQELIAGLGDPGLVEVNLTRLDGRQSNEDDLHMATTAMPFLAERRLVIFTHPFARLGSETARARFLSLLEKLPPSAALVLVIEDHWKNQKNRSGAWEVVGEDFPRTHWLARWCEKSNGKGIIKDFHQPQLGEMPGWIHQQARELGGQFHPQAAVALASHVGNNTRLARLEIEKLLTYVDFQRPVTAEDVETLTAPGGPVNIFEMVDALATGKSARALRMLHQLLEEQDPVTLFTMVVRQFRLLIQTREIIEQGGNEQEVARLLGQPGYIARKLFPQAQRFRMSELELIYRQLLKIDESTKTSQMPLDLALDTFVASLATGDPASSVSEVRHLSKI